MNLKKLACIILSASLIMGVAGGKDVSAATESDINVTTSVTEVTETFETITEAGNTTEKEDKKDSDKSKDSKKKKKVKKGKTGKEYTKAELRLMASIIYCEANIEPYAGKLAVGIVVMNRIESKEFPNNLKDVIYQKGQFSPVRNGALKKALARYDAGKFTSKNEKQCIKAAKLALQGEKNVKLGGKLKNMKSYKFFSVYLSGARLKIKGHRFK